MPGRTETRLRSRSPARGKKAPRSRSRSRSRSRGRSKSPARKSPARKAKTVTSESPSRQSRQSKPKLAKTPTTPTRHSRRLEEKAVREEEELQVKEQKAKESDEDEVDYKSPKDAQSKKKEKSSLGRNIMALVMMLSFPALLLVLNLACTKKLCSITIKPRIPTDWREYLDPVAAAIFFGFLSFQVLLAMIPVGSVAEGLPLKSGKKGLKYRCNGSFALLTSVALFGVLVYLKKPVTLVYDKFIPLMVTGTIFSAVFSIFLYLRSRKRPANELSPEGNTGSVLYDFLIGRELNPRIGSLDLKNFLFFHAAPIGWVLVNLVLVTQAYQTKGTVSPALALLTAFQIFFVADGLWFQDAGLTMMFFTHEGLGFMASFAFLAFIPFVYTLQPRYLLEHPQQWNYWALAGFVLLQVVGYIIYRGSNWQKNCFKRNPHDPALAHLDTIPASSGKKLLASGWWGLVRHPNYLGDLITSLAWTLPCGFSSPLPYFYCLFLLLVLLDRIFRYEAHCRQKYDAAWERYCQKVKYRLIPYVF